MNIQTKPVTSDTIIAQCTPQGSGALALLRLSGTNAFTVGKKMANLASGKTLDHLKTHTIQYGWVVDTQGNHIDQVLFLIMHAPKTFTGENTLEITCHNNPFIIDAIIQQAIGHGARLAQPGEFTKQAVINNKLDILQAEAINELIHANTQQAMKQSLAQLQGSLSQHITDIESHLVKALALSEASFEFIEEDVSFDQQINEQLSKVSTAITTIHKQFDQQKQIRQGVRVAIIGTVNAGKSSLFNTLLGTQRAIVTSQAGTTRDTVEASIYYSGNYITLVDTAGLRKTNDAIEQEGINRSWNEAAQADIIFLVYDGSQNVSIQAQAIYQKILEHYPEKIIVIRNKADQANNTPNKLPIVKDMLSFSSKNGTGQQELHSLLVEKIAELTQHGTTPFLLNQRQYTLVCSVEKKVHEAYKLLKKDRIAHELLSYHLQQAIAELGQLSGKTIHEKMLNSVFSTFCVGK